MHTEVREMCLAFANGSFRRVGCVQSDVCAPYRRRNGNFKNRVAPILGPSSAPGGPGASAPASPLARLNLSTSADQVCCF